MWCIAFISWEKDFVIRVEYIAYTPIIHLYIPSFFAISPPFLLSLTFSFVYFLLRFVCFRFFLFFYYWNIYARVVCMCIVICIYIYIYNIYLYIFIFICWCVIEYNPHEEFSDWYTDSIWDDDEALTRGGAVCCCKLWHGWWLLLLLLVD